jgi:hypothetical protein
LRLRLTFKLGDALQGKLGFVIQVDCGLLHRDRVSRYKFVKVLYHMWCMAPRIRQSALKEPLIQVHAWWVGPKEPLIESSVKRKTSPVGAGVFVVRKKPRYLPKKTPAPTARLSVLAPESG